MSLTPHDFERIRQIVSDQIERKTNLVLQEIRKVPITTQDQFDTSLAQLLAAEDARDTAVLGAFAAAQKAFTDLQTKITDGTVPATDLSSELVKVQALIANANTLAQNAAAITQTATQDDPGTIEIPTTPSPTTSSSSPATPSAGSDATTTTQAS